MFRVWMPDRLFPTYDAITVDFLKEEGIEALILDIDNTIAPYEVAEPDERALAWFADLKAAGIRASFVSNNHAPRAELFNHNLGLFVFADSKKPCGKNLRLAMEAMHSTAENTAVVGDQIFTDVWAGKRLGMRAYIVPPIKDKRTLFFRIKRLLEKPIMRAYRKKNKEELEG
ncbi:MAG: YqeG family HAD IIIA-type phosphatase [Clostridia bacterium]|nr:YqeG family HAD IIIA-type phosphatase [Clostridia bacterium]